MLNIRFINPNDENVFVEAMIKILIPYQKQSLNIHNTNCKSDTIPKNEKVGT